MRIGIVSDTHNHHRNVRRAIEILATERVECVLHAGDITSASTVELFAELPQARLVAVFGNCDADRASLRTAIGAVGGETPGDHYKGRLDGRAIYMVHVPDSVGTAAHSGAYDLVVYGHTHRQDIRRAGRTLVVNPGPATNRLGQPAYVVILDTVDMSTAVRSLDA